MTNPPQPMPAGWYPDPEQPSGQRYWTGSEWDDNRLSQEQEPEKRNTKLLLIPALACIGLVIAALLIRALADSPDSGRDPIAVSADSSSTTTARPTITTATELPTTTTAPTTTTTFPPAQLQAEIDAEAQEACAVAGTSGDAATIDFSEDWRQIGATRHDVQAIADACATEARQAAVDGAGPIDVDAVIRDPDAVQGQFFTMTVEIVQFDAATGPCAFRGHWDNQAHEYNFEYAGDNGVFSAPEPCPVLDGIDNEDVVRLWVEGAGSVTYDTSVGGSATVPAFEVVRTEIIRKG